ncbi:MAG: carbon-nitrogen hydrolase family protein [Thermoanaerobaculia bacterium]|nr:carbon-nitrogen hydrolase family protein [Thermoanaerobaculia bacterium]
MPGPFLAAAVQLRSTSDEEANLRLCTELVERAAGYGATLVVTPENTNYLGPHKEKVRLAQELDGAVCSRFGDLAAKHGIHLVLGSFNEKSEEEERCFNTSVYFGPGGDVLGVYSKIHLFDVDVSDEVRFQESATIRPGAELVVVDDELGAVGLSICYDLRFPELYAALVARGAQILTVPSAFTLMTGKDHWYPLLRARAIETQAWVIAPAQTGRHDDKGLRHSYGHSLIIDPWGQVVGAAPEGAGLALAEIDPGRVPTVRRAMPVASHRVL